MSANTRLPDRLQEIYGALGNDSFLLQECLARPALVDRLVRDFFSWDTRIHAAARQKADGLREQLVRGDLDAVLRDARIVEAEVARLPSEQQQAAAQSGQPDRLDLPPEDFL